MLNYFTENACALTTHGVFYNLSQTLYHIKDLHVTPAQLIALVPILSALFIFFLEL